MSNSRYIIFTIGLPLLMLIAVVALFIWPNYHRASSYNDQARNLLQKEGNLAAQTARVETLARKLQDTRKTHHEELKDIPASPDLASLIRRLSLPVDGRTIGDQTFTAGNEKEAIVGEDTPFRAMPVTIEMDARFDSIFALVQAVESVRRLVRVTAVRMSVDLDDKKHDQDLLKASVELEVIYETPNESKG